MHFPVIETDKSQNFPMVAFWGVPKLSTSPEVTIFSPLVPYPFISDQCLKDDRWTTLPLRNSIVALDLWNLQTHKIWIILRGENYVSMNLLVSTHLLLYIDLNILNFCKFYNAVFQRTFLGNFYSFKLAKFVPCKTHLMVILNLQIVDIVIIKSSLNSCKQL